MYLLDPGTEKKAITAIKAKEKTCATILFFRNKKLLNYQYFFYAKTFSWTLNKAFTITDNLFVSLIILFLVLLNRIIKLFF